MPQVTMRQMLEAGVHFGHQTRYWNPRMAPYIFGARGKIHIINLEKTLPLFTDAMNFISGLAQKRGTILFVGTKRSARDAIKEEAARCGMPLRRRALARRHADQLPHGQGVDRSPQGARADGDRRQLREARQARSAAARAASATSSRSSLGGIKDMNRLPDALFVIDIGHENIAVLEAKKLGIPVIAVVDTNYDPALVDYAIPGNDDAIRAVQLYVRAAADAVLEGKAAAPQMAAGEKDDFVELDAEGNPVTKEANDRERNDRRRPAPRKAPAKRPAARRGPPPPRGPRPERAEECAGRAPDACARRVRPACNARAACCRRARSSSTRSFSSPAARRRRQDCRLYGEAARCARRIRTHHDAAPRAPQQTRTPWKSPHNWSRNCASAPAPA